MVPSGADAIGAGEVAFAEDTYVEQVAGPEGGVDLGRLRRLKRARLRTRASTRDPSDAEREPQAKEQDRDRTL